MLRKDLHMPFENDLLNLTLAQLIATLGGVIVVFIVDVINNIVFKTKEKLLQLIEETSILLIDEACYYSNPESYEELGELGKQEYARSSKEMRKIASKLLSFSELNKNTFCKVSSLDVSNAGSLLMAVSNSYYRSYDMYDNNSKKLMKLKNY